MVTGKQRVPIPRSPKSRQVTLYLREWRKFMGVKAPEIAEALGIERESYLRHERETWRVSYTEAIIIAEAIGIQVTQLKFPPPLPEQEPVLSLDEMIEGQSETVQKLAIAAVKGMIGGAK